MAPWVWLMNDYVLGLVAVSQSCESVRAKNIHNLYLRISCPLFASLMRCTQLSLWQPWNISVCTTPSNNQVCANFLEMNWFLVQPSKTYPAVFKDGILFVQELVQMELKKSRDIPFFLLWTGM